MSLLFILKCFSKPVITIIIIIIITYYLSVSRFLKTYKTQFIILYFVDLNVKIIDVI